MKIALSHEREFAASIRGETDLFPAESRSYTDLWAHVCETARSVGTRIDARGRDTVRPFTARDDRPAEESTSEEAVTEMRLGTEPTWPAEASAPRDRRGDGVTASKAIGQQGFFGNQPSGPPPPPGSTRKPGVPRPQTGPGYKNTANRLGHNGPMDDTSAKIVKFVSEFDASKLTDATTRAINRTMIDSMAAVVAGFEEESVRIAARVSRHAQPVGLTSTVMGYGISTTPELATFANCCLIRATDFNDNGDGGHDSDLIPAALAIGEALHASGPEVMAAVAVGYEIKSAPAGGESVAAAMVAGKLMKLDQDRLANALSIALTPHVALNKGVGALSMWKGVRSAEAMKCGVWAAILAREGMTGPPQPFEGRGALWAQRTRPRVHDADQTGSDGDRTELVQAAAGGSLLAGHAHAGSGDARMDEARRDRVDSVRHDGSGRNLRQPEMGSAKPRDGRSQHAVHPGARAPRRRHLSRLVHGGEVHGSGGAGVDGQDDLRSGRRLARSRAGPHHDPEEERQGACMGTPITERGCSDRRSTRT